MKCNQQGMKGSDYYVRKFLGILLKVKGRVLLLVYLRVETLSELFGNLDLSGLRYNEEGSESSQRVTHSQISTRKCRQFVNILSQQHTIDRRIIIIVAPRGIS